MSDEITRQIWIIVGVILTVLIIAVTVDDIIEKTVAIKAGLCQTRTVGGTGFAWQKC